jgi:hypothetical protein
VPAWRRRGRTRTDTLGSEQPVRDPYSAQEIRIAPGAKLASAGLRAADEEAEITAVEAAANEAWWDSDPDRVEWVGRLQALDDSFDRLADLRRMCWRLATAVEGSLGARRVDVLGEAKRGSPHRLGSRFEMRPRSSPRSPTGWPRPSGTRRFPRRSSITDSN